MHRATLETVAALGLMVLCGLGAAQAADFPGASAYLPAVVLAAATVLSLIWAIQSGVRRMRGGAPITIDRIELRRFATMVVAVVAIGALIPLLGFFTAFCLLIPGTTWALGYRDWRVIGAATAVFVGLLHVAFVMVLERPLPREIWQGLIG